MELVFLILIYILSIVRWKHVEVATRERENMFDGVL